MVYRYSQLDRDNLAWFSHDVTRATLLSIRIVIGAIRGLRDIQVDFAYPITALAGRNGSGKTTLLSLAACAFHAARGDYKLKGRKTPYYTISDFFIQTSDEVPLEGVRILYRILHNRWKITRDNPERERPGWQARTKRRGGRWTNYERRIERPVVYLGNDRIVPHAEKSISRSYRRLFQPTAAVGWEDDVRAIVGRILRQDYTEFEYRQHSKYSLPIASRGATLYSGFNMGAGEDALFQLVSTLLDCPDGTLMVIDEIELGLHEEAQSRLIMELKRICLDKHSQVICTTHSPRIIESLPPEGRVFLELVGDTTKVIPGISAAYASGKLAGRPTGELQVLVEDNVSQRLIELSLAPEQRNRVSILPIGSAKAVMSHFGVKYREARDGEVCVFLDGDQRANEPDNIRQFLSLIERQQDRDQARQWAQQRLYYLPGDIHPEAWAISQRGPQLYARLQRELGIGGADAEAILHAAQIAQPHAEFFEAAELANVDKEIVEYQILKGALESAQDEQQLITECIQGLLL